MNNFFKHLIKRKFIVLFFFVAIISASIYLIQFVDVNYDMTDYLPENAGTKTAVIVISEEFGYPGTAEAMVNDVSINEALKIKQNILGIPGVKAVKWLDDVLDIRTPKEQIPQEILSKYYIDDSALFRIEFFEDNYSTKTSDAIDQIKEIEPRAIVAGNAENGRYMKSVLSGEILGIIILVLPVFFIILFIASHSWLEPILYLLVIGISIVLNMGTNVILGNISFITNSMSSLLQLAICMDYSIFLMHRYFEERDNGSDVPTSIRNASSKSIKSISASALTTIAGFLALLFMRYKIGTDVGLVLAKGIFISFVTVTFFMPVAIKFFSKSLEKARHKPLLPSFRKFGKITFKARYFILGLVFLLVVPVFIAQSNNNFFYGDSSITTGEGEAFENRSQINDIFGISNNIAILVPKGDRSLEASVAAELYALPYIDEVISFVTVIDQNTPIANIPDELIKTFTSESYSRIIVNLSIEGESAEVFDTVANIRQILQEHYPDVWYAAGISTSLTDIKDTVDQDSKYVTLISLFAVGLVILLISRSLSIPLILLFVIQTSVWINMAIPYLTGFKMAFIGYLVISSLQLGATIDYGILLTNRYKENRAMEDRNSALLSALITSGPSILISAMILATAGFGFGIVSKVSSISELGLLIGRGALLSCIMSLVALPAMLYVFDKFIVKTTLNGKDMK